MENATEFNHTLLADLIISGYKYILYVAKNDCAILKPLKEAAPDHLVFSLDAYQLRINELEIINIASGDSISGFKFYVQTDLFES